MLLLIVLLAAAAGFVAALVICITYFNQRAKSEVDHQLKERKDQFISLASHYLLNPITIIQTALARLQEKDMALTTEQRGTLYDAIMRGQQRLWIVVQQMILVGEIDQNNLRLQLTVTDLYDVVSGAVAAVDPFAREKKLTVHIIDKTKEVREVRIDPRRMKLAFIAALDNAIKFSLEGGQVLVTMTLEGGIFTVQVQDEGIGMPEEILSHVTEKFYRGTEMYTFNYEGLGLGLHIAQAIVRMHQGNITFASEPNKGTTVLVEFPQL